MSGVLSGNAIKRYVDGAQLIVEGYRGACVQPASYNVTIAETGLITPTDKRIPPKRPSGHDDGYDSEAGVLARARAWPPRPTRRPVVLEPGDTAVFSSRERFELPTTIAGNVTVKNTYAAQGLMLLSGMLIDPGYGKGDAHGDGRPGCPLYLHVANMGREPIALIPGIEDIARVQFLHVDEAPSDDPDPISGSRWENQRLVSLGFLSDLKELKERVDHTDSRTQLVLGGALAVILVALIGAAASSILSIATDKELTGDLQGTWGALSLSQAIMWSSLMLGVPILMLALALGSPRLTVWLKRRRRLRKRPWTQAP